jgi:hypothetical protein
MKGLLHVFQYSLTPDALRPSRLSRAPNCDEYDRSVTLILVAKIFSVYAIDGFLFPDLIITE